ncbi:hypothetical protein ACFE04_003381 [Oxalis oulophora]
MSSLSILLLILSLAIFTTNVLAHPTKLFIFGDSYVDAGNSNPLTVSWLPPYGVTYPGKPSGRFSDGKVLSDFIAGYLGIETPVVYRLRPFSSRRKQKNGMNFAYGGTGVFPTRVNQPTLGQQVGLLQQLVQQNVYTKQDLDSSVALVSLAGNDYGDSGRGADSGFRAKVVNQLSTDLKILKGLGVRKIAVTAIEAVGCLPGSTNSSGFTHCDDALNLLAQSHNQLLSQAVKSLNGDADGSFFIVDLYTGFLTALQKKSQPEEAHVRSSRYAVDR